MRQLPLHAALAGAAAAWCAAPLLAQEGARPAFQTLRYEEDWSLFEPVDDPWDPIKHVDLSEDGDFWASFGGELRLRGEAWENFAFAEDNDDGFLLARALLHADLRFGDHVRAFVQGKSALETGRTLPGGPRPLDVDQLDLQNAFVDLVVPLEGEASVTARVGRQELLFGRQRLVSPLPWSNSMRTWDGARLILELADWRIDAFYTRYAAVQKYEFNDWRPGPDFYGLYATGAVGGGETPATLDLYALGLSADDATVAGATGEEDRYTFGARLAGPLGASGFDFEVEGAYQTGEVGAADVSAYFFASRLGYAFSEEGWKPRMHVGLGYASGDEDPGDGNVGTFNQLFPLGHAYLGYMDFIGRQNLIDATAGFSIQPHAKLVLSIDGHLFWRASDEDAVYNAGGGVLRAGPASSASEVGQEIDVTAVWRVDRHLTVEAGYSHFFAGEFLDETGPSEDADWVYLQTTYRF